MSTGPPSAVAVLRRLRRDGVPAPARTPEETCELCRVPIPDEHNHVVDLERRTLLCACRPCYLLFTSSGAGGGHFRAVPERYLAVDGFAVSPAQWDALQIPVGVAFFFVDSRTGRAAAFYPGPAGATESELPLDAWDDLVRGHPTLTGLEPDVEAVLVRSTRATSAVECYVVPIDACYELVGILRRLWRGFDGGQDARAALDGFFARVRERAR